MSADPTSFVIFCWRVEDIHALRGWVPAGLPFPSLSPMHASLGTNQYDVFDNPRRPNKLNSFLCDDKVKQHEKILLHETLSRDYDFCYPGVERAFLLWVTGVWQLAPKCVLGCWWLDVQLHESHAQSLLHVPQPSCLGQHRNSYLRQILFQRTK